MAEAQENAIKQAKIKRRNCKGALTRQGKVVCHKLSANRPSEEIRKELIYYQLYDCEYSSVVDRLSSLTKQVIFLLQLNVNHFSNKTFFCLSGLP